MNRKDLLDKLETVSPALSDSDLLPVMTHFWFTGGGDPEIMAYNDQIGISVPFDAGVEGAVPGAILLSLLKNSKALAVEFTPQEAGALKVKAASSTLTLALLPAKQFLFDMPEPRAKDTLPWKSKAQFLDCIETCMRSVGADTSVPDQLGVTLIPNDDSLDAYSTNNSSLSYARIGLTKPSTLKKRVILPGAFCNQMLKLGRSVKDFHIEFHDDYALFVAKGVRLFGRLIESERPVDFAGAMKHHFPDGVRKQLVPIPTKLRLILERAIIITDAAADQGTTVVTCKDRQMKFVSKTDRGEVVDTMQVGDGQPDVAVRLEPKLLKHGYEFFDEMVITDRCAIMARGHMLYLVSAHTV